ncbi:polyprenyl synthetase family protein [Agromyces sp. SYSU T00194]|uniref:polyprenyl synthetase family protein n=1 Tax=Agromyces chitinivorans TaxID=3158560 RepID=UPI003393A473
MPDPTLPTDPLEADLRGFFAESRSRAERLGPHYRALWDALEQASAGGKRIRPRLVQLAHDGLGGTERIAVRRVGLAFELLHTAFVIHDDVIDGDLTRRGAPNVAGAFRDRARAHGADDARAALWGETAALLAGDLALAAAHRLIAEIELAPDRRTRVLDLLDHAVFVSAAGELADVTNAEAEQLSIDDVVATLEQKTAVYTFQAPLQAGAVLAGADEAAVAALGRFGRLAGIAFQLADDVLGVFGDEQATGKSTLSDLREGKQTTLIAHATTTGEWPVISPLVGKADLDEDEAASVRSALVQAGSLDQTNRIAREHVTLALHELDSAPVPAALRDELAGLARTAVERIR